MLSWNKRRRRKTNVWGYLLNDKHTKYVDTVIRGSKRSNGEGRVHWTEWVQTQSILCTCHPFSQRIFLNVPLSDLLSPWEWRDRPLLFQLQEHKPLTNRPASWTYRGFYCPGFRLNCAECQSLWSSFSATHPQSPEMRFSSVQHQEGVFHSVEADQNANKR